MLENEEMVIPQRNSAQVTVTYTGLENNVGISAKLTRKARRRFTETDAVVYTASISVQLQSVFTIPAADNDVAGIEWYRVDVISDGSGEPRTAICGPLVISPV